MPIYEYLCSQCRKRFKLLVGVVSGTEELCCPHCSSANIARQVSRFARVRSEDDALDSLADEMEGVDENDPRAIKRLMKQMGSELGEDMDEEIEQMMEEEEPGEEGSSDEDL